MAAFTTKNQVDSQKENADDFYQAEGNSFWDWTKGEALISDYLQNSQVNLGMQ